ncbi:uncharacterized protein LOC124401434 [Silurus meridionalis]|uniref:Ig-like domain-containing protein n=1 Tax=Silurus meridionalis TaxID=175797 RepID=A0A8T0AND4_SILME|nr:uncharacterized protein LOC124401434 [Silurus meridionalis]KAF7694452.1 hypothetical protein HF521_008205 [Silurus meridionalis]
MKVFFLLLLIQLHITEGCRKLEGNTDVRQITAYPGDSVLLSCSCTDLHTKPQSFTWSKYSSPSEWINISLDREPYKYRYQLVNEQSSGNLSLLISNLTVEDGGDYRCNLTESEYRQIRLTVHVCTRNQQTVSVTGYMGKSVLLPCFLSEPSHTLRWLFSKECDYKEIFPKNQIKGYTDRVQQFNDHSGNISLLISDLTVKDGGYYMCEIRNSSNTTIHLTVKGALTGSSASTPVITTSLPTSTADTTTIFICTAVALMLLLLLGGVMYWKSRGQRRRQIENGDEQPGMRIQQNEQEDVMYMTVDHSNTVRAEQTPVASEDTAVYSLVQTH